MTQGDIALAPLPQADGRTKLRPVILLRQVPHFGDWLICGVSTQLHHSECILAIHKRVEHAYRSVMLSIRQ
jgi:hypothetical protein